MKRLDVEPTTEALLDSISADLAGRNADVIDFIKVLSETEGPYTYMIDASWGDGKSFFLRSVELVLKELNPKISDNSAARDKLKPVLDNLEGITDTFLPFYFNAWENDFAEDPIAALFACMAVKFDETKFLKETNIRKAITEILDAGLALVGASLSVSSFVEALDGSSLIDGYEKRSKIRSLISELAEKAIEGVANKLVIFIDELDRCRPDFAVRLLEETKSLFASKNIILVFATDSTQLAKAVGGMYGAGFDSARFLERFFDQRMLMTPVDSLVFVAGKDSDIAYSRFELLVKEIISSKSLTIRDVQRLNLKLDQARKYYINRPSYDYVDRCAVCTVLPLLVFIQHENMELFRRITSGADYDALF